jgi:hypothetical protein
MQSILLPTYPFPYLLNPHAAQMDEDISRLFDVGADYGFLSVDARKKYERMRLGLISARMWASSTDLAFLRPASRFITWGTVKQVAD